MLKKIGLLWYRDWKPIFEHEKVEINPLGTMPLGRSPRFYCGLMVACWRIPIQESASAQIDDLVQETLLKLQSIQTLQRVKIAGSAAGYVAVMLRNAATDLVRRRQRGQDFEIALSEELVWQNVAEPVPLFPERAAHLPEALRWLSPEERNLLRMRFWRGLTIAEIAAVSNTTYSATAVRLFRILESSGKDG